MEGVWCALKYSGDADGYRVTALPPASSLLQTICKYKIQSRRRVMRRTFGKNDY